MSRPNLDEPAVRLVYTDIGLPELFARTAADSGLATTLLHADDVLAAVVEKLGRAGAKKVYLPQSSLLGRLDLPTSIESAGFTIVDEPAADAAVTDCYAAIAETGSLAFELTAASRRALSAKLRIAVVDPRACVADLLDLMERVRVRPGELLIESGPSDFVALVLT